MLFVLSLSAPISVAGQSPQCIQMGPEPDCSVGAIGCQMDVTGPLVEGHCDPENEGLYIIRTYVHRVQDDNGQYGQPLSAINEGMNIMIEQFAPLGILFSLEEVDELNESLFMDFDVYQHYYLLADHINNQDGMDIFALPVGVWDGAAAFFPFHEYTACIMGGASDELQTVLSHEVGHIFGLFHTFATICGDCPPLSQTCACGDYVMDTSHDPLSFYCVSQDCEYGPSHCQGGATFPGLDPPIENHMSYSPRQCRSEFTEGQKRRMKRYLTTCEKLQGTLVNGPIKIADGFNITIASPISQCLPGFIVESGARLTIATDLRFQEGAKIVVEPGGRLIIDNAHLSGCGNDHWEGIVVKGKPNLGQVPLSNQGVADLKNNTVVEKAARPLLVDGGGVVFSRDVSYINCGASVFYPYTKSNLGYFINSNFVLDSDFDLPNELGQVVLWGLWNMKFSNCYFSATAFPNAAGNYNYAIAGVSSRFQVYNNTQIEGFYTGIASMGYGGNPLSGLRAENCKFIGNFIGIENWYGHGAIIRNNQFSGIGEHPFQPGGTSPSPRPVGLILRDCTGFAVTDNAFSGSSTGDPNTIGMLAWNTGSESNVIRRNTFEGLNVANQAELLNRDPIEGFFGLQYWCNTNTSANNHDFYIWDEGIAGLQGENGNATKNIFSHPNGGTPNTTYEDYNNQSSNPINYFHLNLPGETPEVGYYFNIDPVQASEAVSCLDEEDDDHKLTSEEEEQLTQDFNNARTAHQSQSATYEALPPGSLLAPELERQMASSIGTMHRIANRLIRSELADTIALNIPKIRTWLANKESLEAAYAVVETYLYELDTLLARQVRDSIPLKYGLTDAQTSNHNSYVQWTELKIGFYRKGKDILALDTSSVLLIQDMADNSTEKVAAQTQGLLNFAYGYDYRLHPKLPDSGSQGLMTPPKGGAVNMQQVHFEELNAVPNPARDEVTFRYSLPAEIISSTLIVTDVNGSLVARFDLTDNTGLIRWPTGQLPSGIYFYAIRYTGSQFSPRKLVLIK